MIIIIMIKSLNMSVGFAPPESVSSLTECVAQWDRLCLSRFGEIFRENTNFAPKKKFLKKNQRN